MNYNGQINAQKRRETGKTWSWNDEVEIEGEIIFENQGMCLIWAMYIILSKLRAIDKMILWVLKL